MPTLLDVPALDENPESSADRAGIREQVAETMAALVPMTRMVRYELPGRVGTRISTGTVRPGGDWSLSQPGWQRGSATGDYLTVLDVTRPMRVDLSADTKVRQMFLSAAQLGLPVGALRAGAATIERSPLRRLVANHVLQLPVGDAAADTGGVPLEALDGVGHATIELVRTMLIAAVRPTRAAGARSAASTYGKRSSATCASTCATPI